MGRNTQMLRQNLPVSRRLIQHTNIVGIRKNAYRLNTASHNILRKSDLLDR